MRRCPTAFTLTTIAVCLPAQTPPAPPRLGDFLEPTSALARETHAHAGVVGRVQEPGGAPVAGATVLVFAYRPFYWALPLARTKTDDAGSFRCDDFGGDGRTMVWVVSPEDTPFRTASQGLSLVSGRTSELRPITLPAATGEVAAATSFRGRLLAKDDQPIAGAMLRLASEQVSFDPSCYALTDAAGAFTIPVRTATPQGAQLFLGDDRLLLEHEAGAARMTGDPPRLKLDLTGERTLQHDSLTWVEVRASGADGIELAWRLGDTFHPCVGGRAPGAAHAFSSASATVRASAPGHLPRLGRVPGTEFTFAGDVLRELRVVDDAGKPVANAFVDLCDGDFGGPFRETVLDTARTAADGTLRLRAPEQAEVVVYAYADGCAPARGIWTGDTTLQLTAVRRTARLRVELDDDVSTIYVRRAGTFDLAAMAYPNRGGLDVDVAPGAYEVTRYRSGPVAAAKAVVLAAGAVTALALDADERPTIEVTVPEFAGKGEWWLHAGRSALGGMVAKRMIWTTRGGPMPTRELVAEVEANGDRRFLLRLPTSGRYTLVAGHESLPHRLLREVVVEFGHHYAIAVPPLDGVLRGTIAAMPELWGDDLPTDGIAGPRLWLEPEGDTAFGALVTLPEPKQFRLEHLPRGTYSLHHHLYETDMFGDAGGSWGGAEVAIAAEAADAGTLGRGPDGALTVHVLGADGKPARGRLAVRDRMSESWQQVMRENSTLIYASDPIPAPPAARLVDGAAKFEKVRAGRIAFELRGDDGATTFFAREVAPGTRLEVQLGAGK